MKRRIFSLVLAIVLVTTLTSVTQASAAANVNDLKSSIEKKYSVKMDFSGISDWSEWDYEDQLYVTQTLGDFFALIPTELHSALVSHFKSKGKTITIKFTYPKDDYYAATYSTATITIYDLYLWSDTFAHEYGHMLHDALKDKYGASKFSKEWMALHDGPAYGSYPNTLDEDVADTFMLFTAMQGEVRANYESYLNTSQMKKAMYLEQIAKSSLKIKLVYFPYYIPQTPSSWAVEAIKRGFATNGNGQQVLSGDNRLYQEPITRSEICGYLIGMIDSVCYARYERHIFPMSLMNSSQPLVTNPKTGAATLDVEIKNNFKDCSFGDNAPAYANYLGIVKGVSATEFNPNGLLTREQAAVILEKACDVLGIEDKAGETPVPSDAGSISSWARSSVDFVLRNGIMTGTGGGAFSPKGTYSYEQAYVTLIRLYDTALSIPTEYVTEEFTIATYRYGELTREVSKRVGDWPFTFEIADVLSEERLSMITWTSSNPDVATVEPSEHNMKSATVTVLSSGTVTITASDGSYSSSITFTVED